MKKTIAKFYLFGTLGLSAEIIFTAIMGLYHMYKGSIPFNLKLQGNSYIWMFFIYGLAAFLFPVVYKNISRFPLLARLLIYAMAIFIVEFITGWLLDITTGKCPWEYVSRWNICGYIRLDFLPVWILFGYIGEKANSVFDQFTESI